MPDFRIAGLQQDRNSAIWSNTQQGAIPLKVVLRYQEPLAIRRPIDSGQTAPSFYNQVTRLARGRRAELDLVLVRAIKDDGSLRAIGRQTPIEGGFNLRGKSHLAGLYVEPESF